MSVFFVRPTIFSEVTPDMTIAREEIFGPVLCILPYEDENEAVEIANDTDYGLAGAVSSADKDHAVAVARRLAPARSMSTAARSTLLRRSAATSSRGWAANVVASASRSSSR